MIGAGTGGAVAPPTKLLGEQVIHPAPPTFFLTNTHRNDERSR